MNCKTTRATSLIFALSGLLGLALLSGCLILPPDRPTPAPQRVTHDFRSIALLPVQFVSSQPDSFCHADIGEDLRGALVRHLRARGYQAFLLPDRSPQSFALDPPTPDPGVLPEIVQQVQIDADTALGVWVEDYMATGLCERYGGGNTLEMGVAVVLYALPEGKELGRWRAREWDTRLSTSQETVWRVVERLANALLAGLP